MATSTKTLGLREAAEHFGVSVDTLRRRIKSGDLPEATKADGKFGSTWVVPLEAMVVIAERERWVLTLNATEADAPSAPVPTHRSVGSAQGSVGSAQGSVGSAQGSVGSAQGSVGSAQGSVMPSVMPARTDRAQTPVVSAENLDWVERLLAAETRATTAEAQVGTLSTEVTASERRINQLTRDLEQERSEMRRLRTDLTNEEKAKAVAQARTEELRKQIDRDRGDFEARIVVAQGEAHANAQRADSLAGELGDAQAAMGWWARRKLEKTTSNKK